MRAILDTNVLLAALIRPGPSRAVLNLAGTHYQLCASPALFDEADDVFYRPRVLRKYQLDVVSVTHFLEQVRQVVVMVPGVVTVPKFEPDPKDTKFLACALEARADYLVTGDRALQALGSYEGTEIISPRQFLDIVQASA